MLRLPLRKMPWPAGAKPPIQARMRIMLKLQDLIRSNFEKHCPGLDC